MIAVGSRSAAWLCAFFVTLVVLDGVTAGSTESGQARDRKAKSKDLTDKKDANGDNLIISQLQNCSLLLSGEELVEWNLMIEECIAVSNNASYTSDEIIGFCASKIKILFGKFPDLRQKFLYMSIGGWGTFNDLFQVAIWINADFTESVIQLNNGQSELEAAILEFEGSISDQDEKVALDELRAEISLCLNDDSLTYEEKMANISMIFKDFFDQHPAWKDDILGIEISGFGTIGSFLDVADMYNRIATFGKLFIISPGETDCDLVVEMTAGMNNPAYNFSRAEKTQLSDFINNIRVLIAGNSALSVKDKIKAIVYQYQQLMLTSPYLMFDLREFSIGSAFGFGTFGDLIDASAFGSRLAPTSPPTTMRPKTSPAPTTLHPQGDCSTVASVIAIFSGNQTVFYQSTNTYLTNNPGTQATNFRPYLINIQNTMIMNGTMTDTQKIQKIASTIKTYCGTNIARSSYLNVIQIGTWGTFQQLLTCGGF